MGCILYNLTNKYKSSKRSLQTDITKKEWPDLSASPVVSGGVRFSNSIRRRNLESHQLVWSGIVVKLTCEADNQCEKERNYKKGFASYKLLHCSANDVNVGRCPDDLGDMYEPTSNDNAALLNYERLLGIHLFQETQIDFQCIYEIVDKIVRICINHKHDYDSTLKYGLIRHEHTLNYYELCSQDDTYAEKWLKKREIADSYDTLADLCMKIHRYNLALKNFRIAVKLYEENQNAKID